MKDERKRILKLVEQGKLSVDEALTLIESLENNHSKSVANSSFEEKVKFEETKKEESVNHKIHFAKEKIFDFVDTSLKKIKDFDFDLNFGQSIEISHIFHQGEVDLKNMDIDVANGSIKIAAWDQPDVRIECQAKVFRVENSDKARQNCLKNVIFSFESSKLHLSN